MRQLALICLFLSIISCGQKNEIDYAIMSGMVTNNDQEKLILTNNDRDFAYEIALKEDGSFKDTLTIEPGLYTLSAGRRKSTSIVFFEGDDLSIKFDADDIDNSLSFDGTGVIENNLLQTIEDETNQWKKNIKEHSTLEENEFKSTLEKKKNELLALLNTNETLNPRYKEMQVRHIDYWYTLRLREYQNNYRYYAENPDFTVSEDFMSGAKDLDFGRDDDFRESRDYKSLVMSELYQRASRLMESGDTSREMAYLNAAYTFKSVYIRDMLLYTSIKGTLATANVLKPSYDTFMELSTNQEHKNKVVEKYGISKALEKGQPSPKFIDYENYNGNTSSLKDFKGKYVYIDVWATWCGPCKAQIPFLKKVEKKYHGNDKIEFVSISLDTKENNEKWRAMVKEKDLSNNGIQLIADNAFKSDFIEEYQIRGIPQFILIDPEGNIVNRSAPRPSNTELVELFNELNI